MTECKEDKWYTAAEKIYVDENSEPIDVSDLMLPLIIEEGLKKNGFGMLYALQHQLLRHILNLKQNSLKKLRDIFICYPTGSGKTLCYVIPILISMCSSTGICAIIFLPSRHLCQQIANVFKTVGQNIPMEIKFSVDELKCSDKNILYIVSVSEIVNFIDKRPILSNSLKFIIFDEAEAIFDRVGNYDLPEAAFEAIEPSKSVMSIEKWHTLRGFNPQIMYISATLKDKRFGLWNMKPFKPILFLLGNDSRGGMDLNPKLTEKIVICHVLYRPLVLIHLALEYIDRHPDSVVLCFVNSVHVIKRIRDLARQHDYLLVKCFFADISREKKIKTFQLLKHGQINFLLATDSLSRGLDLPNIGLVINYEIPQDTESYVHRVGRTCRGNENLGTAVTIITENQKDGFYDRILRNLNRRNEIIERKVEEKEVEYLKHWYEKAIIQLKI